MNISETIERAAKIVGSQKALAELLGEKESSLSAFKRGRPCSYKKHAQIAAVAGMHEEARRIVIQGMIDSLSDDVPHEAEAKAGFIAMLKAFPESLFSGLLRQVLAKHRAAWLSSRTSWAF